MKLFLFLSVCLLTLSACKVVEDCGVMGQISKSDYAYIDKFHEGLRLKAKGEVDFAIEAFMNCYEKKSTDDAVCFALGELYHQKGNLDKAKFFYSKASEANPSNKWYLQELTYLSYDVKDFKSAEKGFEKLIEIEPHNIEWLYGYAETLMSKGAFKKAIKALDQTENEIGPHPQIALQKYKLYLAVKQEKKAVTILENARLNFPDEPMILGTLVDYYFNTKQDMKAIQMLELLAEKDPENGKVHITLAEVYRQLAKKDKFLEEVKNVVKCQDLDLDTKMKLLISIQEMKLPITVEVLNIANELVVMYPDDAKPYSVKGDYLMEMGKDSIALDAYRTALKFDKTRYAIWNQVLVMDYQLRNFEFLYEDSKNCLKLFPNQPIVYLFYGLASNQLEKYDEAIEILEAGKDLLISDKAMQTEFMTYLGDAYFATGQIIEGKSSYEMALNFSPSNVSILNNFAYNLARKKNSLDRAEELVKKAMILAPNQPNIIDTYGYILFQKSEFEAAKAQFELAIELKKEDPTLLEHLGDVLFKLDEVEKAIEFWKKAIEFNADNEILIKKIENKKYYEPESK